ncbi:MAG: TIGR01777 family protein [Piscirickettsiaceae bacterium]|nr:MAG: TIGR01777 family protein [Piscirickettsiaceae bacterium]
MNVLITGGTGFIGSALCTRLLEGKHDITVLSRHPEAIKAPLKGVRELEQLTDDVVFDSVINLAGEPIANKRWSEQQKQRILSSRLDTTEKLIRYFKIIKHKPRVFISGSAIGYYGLGETNDSLDESATGDESFSSQLCQQWESAALQAEALGIRTCLLRTGIVLGKGGGALSKMLPPFKMGLGGRMGTGKHWMSWIHLDDLMGIILYCIHHDNLNGAINGTSPNPVTNKMFTKTLGKVLKRPTLLPMPTFAIKLLMGQMGEELLLSGKRILPVNVLNAGYNFKHIELEDALLCAI